jgi:hypothetical protein
LERIPSGFGKSFGELGPKWTTLVPHWVDIRTDRNNRGIDRSEGTESRPPPPHGYAVLNAPTFSEGKITKHEEYGCIKEFGDTSDDVMRGTALDSSHGCRADA